MTFAQEHLIALALFTITCICVVIILANALDNRKRARHATRDDLPQAGDVRLAGTDIPAPPPMLPTVPDTEAIIVDDTAPIARPYVNHIPIPGARIATIRDVVNGHRVRIDRPSAVTAPPRLCPICGDGQDVVGRVCIWCGQPPHEERN